jgi:hypothetical protein
LRRSGVGLGRDGFSDACRILKKGAKVTPEKIKNFVELTFCGYSSPELQYNFTHLDILQKFFSYAPKKDYTFLDLGCGVGNVLWIATECGAKIAYGIEICVSRVKMGKEILDMPEKFLGGKDEENIFQYLKLHKKHFFRCVSTTRHWRKHALS